MNGVKGSLGRLSMKTGQEVTFKLSLVDAETDTPVKVRSLSMTFLDLDEGKKGKGRCSVEVCSAEQFVLEGSELAVSSSGGCSAATSTTQGTAKDNPSSVEGALVDDVASRRVVSYVFGEDDDGIYSFKLTAGKGFGQRNFLFTMTPGAACARDSHMPEGR